MSFAQPDRARTPEPETEYEFGNTLFAHELAISIQQTFADYQNRNSDDNRSAQTTLGPSEIGSPCDRRIAMSLMGVPAVNEGGDGFAAWLGTQGHRGMADIYKWANGRSGRYSIETPLTFPSKLVPRGTGDLLDRRLRVFIDHKFMGTWSLRKLKRSGPSETYRVQVQTYAGGAVYRGEKVSHVAIAAYPRQGRALNEMFVWSEPYDPSVWEAALARVHEIDEYIRANPDTDILALPIAKDCDWCPFYLPKSPSLEYGCNGRA